MKERPIIFSGPMVRAILSGAKTQTRRPVRPQPSWPHYLQPMWGRSPDGHDFGERHLWREVGPDYPDDSSDDRRCPYGQPGDRLWVREGFKLCDRNHWPDLPHRRGPGREVAYYRANFDRSSATPWRSPIHMPRWASRILLEIVDVRAEQLREISEEDAQAEGVKGPHFGRWTDGESKVTPPETEPPRPWAHSFYVAWREIHGHDVFPPDVWVWALTFKRVEAT